jgi:hypothetical protein
MYLDDPQHDPLRRTLFPCHSEARGRHDIARQRYLETQSRNRQRASGSGAVRWSASVFRAMAGLRAMARKMPGGWSLALSGLIRNTRPALLRRKSRPAAHRRWR